MKSIKVHNNKFKKQEKKMLHGTKSIVYYAHRENL